MLLVDRIELAKRKLEQKEKLNIMVEAQTKKSQQ